MAPGALNRQKLVEYFLEARRPRDQWLVGMEVEKLGRDAATGLPIPYEGAEASVRRVLEHYLEVRSGDPIYEGDHLVGIAGEWGTISLEPGGQVEWSSPPCRDLDLLATELSGHLAASREAGRRCGVEWLDLAVDPTTPLGDMPWMPKARYKILGEYLGARGRLAHRMMTQTASIQCAFDFESDADWARKFVAAAVVSPVAVALFANSSRADGAETGYRSFRQRIWRETDPDRCSLPPVVFDPGFGIEAWVDWVLRVPTVFQQRARGLVSAAGVPFQDFLGHKGFTAAGLDAWELHLSTIFTEVRSYSYLEVRCADLQPDPRILAVPALWTGILYHPEALEQAVRACSGHADHAAWLEAMDSAARDALGGSAGRRPLRELAGKILGASIYGLRNGAACAGRAEDPAVPLLRLAHELGLTPVGGSR